MRKHPHISIIGLGNLGSALLDAFDQYNLPVESIFNRSEQKVKDYGAEYKIDIAQVFPGKQSELGSFIFLTVPDDAIEEVANKLVELTDDWHGFSIVHCSGNASADLLMSLSLKGANIASFHPLQSFFAAADAAVFKDIFFSLQGDPSVFPALQKIALKLGAQTLEVNAQQKTHLHAAAVMASNYLITLLDAAVQTANTGNLNEDQLRKTLLPLVKTTLKNAEQSSFAEALTGPIRRGDLQTIENHLKMLERKPSLKMLYCSLGQQTVELAQASRSLDKTTALKFKKIFNKC